MQSVSAVGGLNTALNSPAANKQVGPPDHAKAWGWRAKQAAAAEETQAVATTEPAVPAETTNAVQAVSDVDATSPEAAATLPPPREADLGSVILGPAVGTAVTPSQDATAAYDVAALLV